jgi:hypothetical protein
LLDEDEFGEWSYLTKVSETGPYTLEACIVWDETMKRSLVDQEVVDKAIDRLARQRGWPKAIAWCSTAVVERLGVWLLPLPTPYLDDPQGGPPFEVRAGSSRVVIKPLILAADDLTNIAGEKVAAKIYEEYENHLEVTTELCEVNDTLHVLSRVTDEAVAADLIDRPRTRLSLVDEAEAQS